MHHTGPISGVATFDGKLVATAGYDNQVILWDAQKKEARGRVLHDHLANQCAFSPNGGLLVSASSDYSARLWALPDLRLKAVLTGHDDDVEMAVFSPDGSMIATCSRDYTIGLYDTAGVRLRRLAGHEADVISVVWSADGTELISSSDDGTIRRWDARTGDELEVIDMQGIETDTVVIASNSTIYSGDDEGRIAVYRNGDISFVPAHRAGIKRLVYSAEFNLIASLSYDRTLRIWSITETGDLREAHSTSFPAIVWPRSGAFLDADTLVFGTFGSTYATYHLRDETWSVDDIEPDKSINAVAYCADDVKVSVGDAGRCSFSDGRVTEVPSLCNFLLPLARMVLTGGQTGEVFDAATGALIHTHRSPINCGASFMRGGVLHAILGAYTGEGIVLKVGNDGATVEHVCDIPLHGNAVKGVAADSSSIFSVCADGSAAWHRISDFERLMIEEEAHTKIANGCARVREGVFTSVSRDLRLRIWDGYTPQAIATPHPNSIKCVACTENGRYIGTGGYFGMAAVYDVVDQTWVLAFRPSSSGISSIAAVPGADAFTCSSYDAQLHTFHVPAS